MTQFQLFDSVKLKESIALSEGGIAPESALGAIVEVFNNGEAYMVELFGDWVKTNEQGDFVPAERDEPEAFMETIGVETVRPEQIRLVKPARETMGVRAHLNVVIDELPEDMLAEVRDFAEFLQQKRKHQQA